MTNHLMKVLQWREEQQIQWRNGLTCLVIKKEEEETVAAMVEKKEGVEIN